MNRRLIALTFGGVFLIVAAIFDPPQTLVYGWIGFLARVLPRSSADGPTVSVSVAAVILFTVGLHWAVRAWKPNWKWRYSAACSTMIFVLFAAGVAMVGTFHMGMWYATSKEPVRVPGLIRGAVARQRTTNDMKQLAFGILNCESTHRAFPPAGTFSPSGRALHGWEIQLGPFLGFYSRELDLDLPWDDPKNESYFRCVIPQFMNGSLPDAPTADKRGFGFNHYSANSHVLRADRSMSIAKITDGTSNTILIGEINASFQPWGKPLNVRDPVRGINRSPQGFGGPPGSGGALFGMADGSVRFIRDDVSRDVMRALATPDGGEEISVGVLQEP